MEQKMSSSEESIYRAIMSIDAVPAHKQQQRAALLVLAAGAYHALVPTSVIVPHAIASVYLRGEAPCFDTESVLSFVEHAVRELQRPPPAEHTLEPDAVEAFARIKSYLSRNGKRTNAASTMLDFCDVVLALNALRRLRNSSGGIASIIAKVMSSQKQCNSRRSV